MSDEVKKNTYQPKPPGYYDFGPMPDSEFHDGDYDQVMIRTASQREAEAKNAHHIWGKAEVPPDNSWLKNTFLLKDLGEGEYDKWVRRNIYYTTADSKFTDTEIGMSLGVNPKFQFTNTCDVRRPGVIKARDPDNMRSFGVPHYNVHTTRMPYGKGQGSYYSEAFDDNEQRIYIRFGEPQYSSMLFWLSSSFDIHKAILYKRGFISQTLLGLIDKFTKIFAIVSKPWMFAGRMLFNLFLQPGKFVSIRDNMYTYWATVENILNSLYVKRTGVPFIMPDKGMSSLIGQEKKVTENFVQELHNLVPDIVDGKTGRISVFAIALRAQSAYMKMMEADFAKIDEGVLSTDMLGYRYGDKHDSYLTNINERTVGFTRWLFKSAYETIGGNAAVPKGGQVYTDTSDILRRKKQLDKERTENTGSAGGSVGDPITGGAFGAAGALTGGVDRTMGAIEYTADRIGGAVGSVKDAFDGLTGGGGASESMRPVGGEEEIPYSVAMNETTIAKGGADFNIDITNEEIARTADFFSASTKDGFVDSNEKNKLGSSASSVDKSKEYNRWSDYAKATILGGGGFAVFNVESTGSVSESFSNSAEPNAIESVFNSVSSKVRSMMSSMQAVTDIPGVGDVVKFGIDTAAVSLSNLSFGLANPLLTLLYGSSVTLPQQWADSTASLPKASYQIKLVSPYGDAYSHIFNIYMPLAMLLAGALPRSTGNATYGAPFMCQLFDRGRVNIPYGMIDSLQITRGTSNLPFGRSGHCNSIDVDLSFIDLNEIISVDMTSSGVITKVIDAISPDFGDTAMDNYINTITGLDVHSQIFKFKSGRLKLLERGLNVRAAFTDPAALGSALINNIPIIGSASKALFENSWEGIAQSRGGF